MAIVMANPMFGAVRGKIGGLVFYSSRGTVCVRTYVKPRNPDTAAQQRQRGLFREAMLSWRELADVEKERYRRRASRLGMTGHNLYISRYMAARSGKGPGPRAPLPILALGYSSARLPSLSVSPSAAPGDRPRGALRALPCRRDGT
jgi:hypothetical protein